DRRRPTLRRERPVGLVPRPRLVADIQEPDRAIGGILSGADRSGREGGEPQEAAREDRSTRRTDTEGGVGPEPRPAPDREAGGEVRGGRGRGICAGPGPTQAGAGRRVAQGTPGEDGKVTGQAGAGPGEGEGPARGRDGLGALRPVRAVGGGPEVAGP